MKSLEFNKLFLSIPGNPSTTEVGIPNNPDSDSPYPTPIAYFVQQRTPPSEKQIAMLHNLLGINGLAVKSAPAKNVVERILFGIQESSVTVDLSPLVHYLREHRGTPQGEFANILGIQQSNLSGMCRTCTVSKRTLVNVVSAAEILVGDDELLMSIMHDCLALKHINITKGPVSKNPEYDLRPIAELLRNNRFTITEVARHIGQPNQKILKVMRDRQRVSPELVEEILDAVYTIAPGLRSQLRKMEKKIGPF